jgi:hypothetical protein
MIENFIALPLPHGPFWWPLPEILDPLDRSGMTRTGYGLRHIRAPFVQPIDSALLLLIEVSEYSIWRSKERHAQEPEREV